MFNSVLWVANNQTLRTTALENLFATIFAVINYILSYKILAYENCGILCTVLLFNKLKMLYGYLYNVKRKLATPIGHEVNDILPLI